MMPVPSRYMCTGGTLPAEAFTLCVIGPLRLDMRNMVVTQDGEMAPLGGRAVALLACLVQAAGEVITKAQLIATAWPDIVVSECNVSSQITALRRVLARIDQVEWLETINPQGYRFVGPAIWLRDGRRRTWDGCTTLRGFWLEKGGPRDNQTTKQP